MKTIGRDGRYLNPSQLGMIGAWVAPFNIGTNSILAANVVLAVPWRDRQGRELRDKWELPCGIVTMKTLLDMSGKVTLLAQGEAAVQRDGRLIVTERRGAISADLYVMGDVPFSLGNTLRFSIEGCWGEATVVLLDLAGARLKVTGKVQGL